MTAAIKLIMTQLFFFSNVTYRLQAIYECRGTIIIITKSLADQPNGVPMATKMGPSNAFHVHEPL